MTLTPADILGPKGRIARRLAHYEHRQEQLDMAEAVTAAIRERRHLVVEAGTGVGKSFAYLVPAILATADKQPDGKPTRVVVSTHTISLQEQLIRKDLPFLNAVIPLEFSAVLVKGRTNYVSLRRLDSAVRRAQTLFSQAGEYGQLRQLSQWAKETSDGSRADLTFRPLPQVWDEVQSEHGNCMGRICPTYNDCHYFRARRRMQNAQVLVVNHALFFSDLAVRRAGASLLPDYHVVIFDEAHTIESVASDHLGLSVSSSRVEYLLNKLYNDRSQRGLFVANKFRDGEQQVDRCRIAAQDFFDAVRQWQSHNGRSNGRVDRADVVENSLSPALHKLASLADCRAESLVRPEEKQDFASAAERVRVLAGELESWRRQTANDCVYWIELVEGRRARVTLAAAPMDVGPALREQLFQSVPTVVATSATLAVGRQRSFDFFKSRIGLTQTETLALGSPFNFEEQATLITVEGMPDPAEQKLAFERAVAAMVRRYAGDGRAFVLFTSYDMLRKAASDLTPWLAERNLALLSQAEGLPPSQMIERFKANPRSVLLGTDSFWQGVDVAGEALQTVIITKLPFSVPDRPLLEARLDLIRRTGRNPFVEHQLPEAVLKLRQGFGRLIRTARDRGTVVILDPRVLTKPYGRTFLESLPKCRRVRERYGDGSRS